MALIERKLAAKVQGRRDSNTVSVAFFDGLPFSGLLKHWGIFQPIADILKLFVKEQATSWRQKVLVLAYFATALFPFFVMPVGMQKGATQPLILSSVQGSLLFVLIVRLWGHGISTQIQGGRWRLLRGISTELLLFFVILSVSLRAHVSSLPLTFEGIVLAQKKYWFVFSQPIGALLCFVGLCLNDCECPYSGVAHGLLKLGQKLHTLLGALLFSLFFLGGWHFFPGLPLMGTGVIFSIACLGLKMAGVIFLLFWVRWTLPHMREDRVLAALWRLWIPLAILSLIVNSAWQN
ncbi:MAG: hypothetical protein A2Y14_03985 [Verrucomicrobia bacterium GWF2_51_19]|nr:MAG: hypothetical protein A2Y14_03985 [Verrucomicrobia bacterium GWF2_51_19]